MKERPFSLNVEDRLTVLEAMIKAADRQRWTLHSVHVRTTHVHVVISAEEPAIKILGYLKARGSHCLKLSQAHAHRDRFWTHHGSTRYLWTHAAISAANRYVLDCQGDRLTWYSSFGAPSEATGS